MRAKLPQRYFHLAFSFVMGTMMATIITFVLALANVGLVPEFLAIWGTLFWHAYIVVVPGIYFLAPIARRIVNRIVLPPPF